LIQSYYLIKKINAIRERQVYNIYHQFEQGRLTFQDALCSGRSCNSTDKAHREILKELLNEDLCWDSNELAYRLSISKASNFRILNQLEARKVASNLVSYNLSPKQKAFRENKSTEYLESYHNDTDF
jgi:hypothetical protein